MTTDSRSELLYSASLLFRAVHNEQPSDSDVWEESIILLRASDEAAAIARAADIGRERSFSYRVNDDDAVRIEFFRVERVYKIEDPVVGDGIEVFSRHLRGSEVRSLLEPFSDA